MAISPEQVQPPKEPKWEIHPHQVYSSWLRFGLASVASIIPIGCALVANDLISRVVQAWQNAGLTFVVISIVLLASWVLGIYQAIIAEAKGKMIYAALGAVYPANVYLLIFLANTLVTPKPVVF